MHNQIDYYRTNILEKTQKNYQGTIYYALTIPAINESTLKEDINILFPNTADYPKKLLNLIESSKEQTKYVILIDKEMNVKYALNKELITQTGNNELSLTSLEDYLINRLAKQMGKPLPPTDTTKQTTLTNYNLESAIKNVTVNQDAYFLMKHSSEQTLKEEFEAFYGANPQFELLKDFGKETHNYNILINQKTLKIEIIYNTLFMTYNPEMKELTPKPESEALADYVRIKKEEKLKNNPPKLPKPILPPSKPSSPSPFPGQPPFVPPAVFAYGPPPQAPRFPPSPPAYGPPPPPRDAPPALMVYAIYPVKKRSPEQ